MKGWRHQACIKKAMARLQWIFLCLLILTVWNGQAHAQAPQCDAIFTQDQINQQPDIFVVDFQDQKPEKLLAVAFANLLEKGQLEESRQIVEILADQGLTSLTSSQFETLKKTRKYASVLRAALQMTAEDHAGPQRFADFVADFGHLNDMIDAKKSDESKALALLVLKGYRKIDFSQLSGEVKTASVKSVKKYLRDVRKEATEIMELKKMTLDQYHEVRKDLKEFLAFYQLADQAYGFEKYADEYKYLSSLNDDLGKLNDEFTAEVINGKADKNKTKIEFPKKYNLKKRVHYFLSHSSIRKSSEEVSEGNF